MNTVYLFTPSMYACNFSVYKIRWFIHLFLVCCLHQNGTSYSIIYVKFPFLLLKINIPRYSNIHVLPSLDFMVYNGVSLNWGALMHSLLFVLKLMINFFQFCTDMVAQVTISLMISNTLHLILCTAPSRSCGLSSGSCQTLAHEMVCNAYQQCQPRNCLTILLAQGKKWIVRGQWQDMLWPLTICASLTT